RARALLDLGQPQQALDALPEIVRDSSLDHAVIAEALGVRVAAYQALQQPDAAAIEVERLLDAAPEHASESIFPMMDSQQRQVEALIETGLDDQASDRAQRTLLPLARAIDQWLGSALSQRGSDAAQDLWQRRAADAYRL